MCKIAERRQACSVLSECIARAPAVVQADATSFSPLVPSFFSYGMAKGDAESCFDP